MKSFLFASLRNFTKIKHRFWLKILTIISITVPVFSFSLLTLSSQIQLQELKNVPNQLETTIAKSLQGKNSPYFQVFMISFDWSYLFKDEQAKSGTPNLTALLIKIELYQKGNTFQLTDNDKTAYNIGLGWWNLIKTTIVDNLTNNQQTGLGYFWHSLQQGTTIDQLLTTKSNQTVVIDDVLLKILKHYNNESAYNSVQAIKKVGQNVHAPTAPTNFTIKIPALILVIIAVILLIFISPSLIAISLFYFLALNGKSWWLKGKTMFKTRILKKQPIKIEAVSKTEYETK